MFRLGLTVKERGLEYKIKFWIGIECFLGIYLNLGFFYFQDMKSFVENLNINFMDLASKALSSFMEVVSFINKQFLVQCHWQKINNQKKIN